MHSYPPRLLQDVLHENLATQPDKVALICEQTRLTYRQLDQMSNRNEVEIRDTLPKTSSGKIQKIKLM